ncbi:hypothetical protein FQN57_004436 [Myotisia sp. PD_48]|nr:hypothetical protein FQN57_004436 [Myotisia sp. PD_48]
MRLRERESLRPPQRYGEKGWDRSTPSRRSSASATPDDPGKARSPRRPRIIPASARPNFEPPPYIDYDPDLPSAKFPTLDRPLPKIESSPHAGPNSGNIDVLSPSRNMNELYSLNKSIHWCEDTSEFDISDEDAELETDQFVEMEDYKDLDVPTHVEWKDISPILQAEIVQNLSEVHSWNSIVSMLRLTSEQQQEACDFSKARAEQLEFESSKLLEMQSKQLRALLRIDNSTLKQLRVPGQLVFRNISKQFIRNEQERPNPDYLMVQASRLLAARRFLRRSGIDTRFAGDWKHDLAGIKPPSHEHEHDELAWTRGTEEGVEQATAARLEAQPRPSQLHDSSLSLCLPNNNVRFINHFGGPTGGACETPVYNDSDGTSLTKTPLNAAQLIFGRRKTHQRGDKDGRGRAELSDAESPLVRLKVNPGRAAQIQNVVTTSQPSASSKNSRQPPSSPPSPSPPFCPIPRGPLESSPETSSNRKRKHHRPVPPNPGHFFSCSEPPDANDHNDDDLPVQRILSGAWWYDTGRAHIDPETTSSKQFQDNLHAARAEQELKRLANAKKQQIQTPIRESYLAIRSSPMVQNSQASYKTVADSAKPKAENPELPSSTFGSPTKQNNPPVDTESNTARLPIPPEVPDEKCSPAFSPITSEEDPLDLPSAMMPESDPDSEIDAMKKALCPTGNINAGSPGESSEASEQISALANPPITADPSLPPTPKLSHVTLSANASMAPGTPVDINDSFVISTGVETAPADDKTETSDNGSESMPAIEDDSQEPPAKRRRVTKKGKFGNATRKKRASQATARVLRPRVSISRKV